MKQATIIIPALNPDNTMIGLIKGLRDVGQYKVLIINDGSSNESNDVFSYANRELGCEILVHDTNLGKGAALKTAFNYILSNNIEGIIATVDADGQHSVSDIYNCINSYVEGNVLLGVRQFSRDIPLRSYIGNVVTKVTMQILTGVNVSDTQTGLRVFDHKGMESIIGLEGNRYEFESNSLIAWQKNGFKFQEVSIETIYDETNSTSHFNPILDSLRIYKSFFKYALSSFSSFGIDLLVFFIMVTLTSGEGETKIIVSSFIARVVSGIYNYSINSRFVFESKNKFSGLYYLALAFVQILISTYLLLIVSKIFIAVNPSILKVCVDSVVFIASFFLQKIVVFKPEVHHESI